MHMCTVATSSITRSTLWILKMILAQQVSDVDGCMPELCMMHASTD
jgi:hypothetical protein